MESAAPPRVTVELGEHHTVEVKTVVELLGGVDGILTGHGVNHEQHLIGMDMLLETADFVHHLLVYGQSTSGIDDDYVVAFGFSFLHGMVGNLIDVFVVGLAVHGYVDALSYDFQLVDGGRAVDVAGHEQRMLVLLLLEHVGQACR